MSETLTLTIPADEWFTSNDRLHWAAKAKKTRALRTRAEIAALYANLGPYDVAHVTAFIGYPTASVADPGNAAPVIKALLDGCTDARVWADDDSRHVIGPNYRREATKAPKGTHTVRLVLVEQAVDL